MTSLRTRWARLLELVFNASGRLGRAPVLAACAVLVAILWVYDHGLGRLGHWLLGWIVHPVLFAAAACLLSQRLHDRGRSGWWAAIVLLAFWLAWPKPSGVLGFVSLAVLVWAAVELGLRSGERGFNRFGPAPRALRSAPPRP